MKNFFKGVRRRIDKLDAAHLREQYKLVADEYARTDMLIHALKEGIVRINADGTFPWGEQGIVLFGGQGGSRTELLAGEDGGVWALGADYENTYLSYINALDGGQEELLKVVVENYYLLLLR